ncbi:efflux RND transporter permease subunit [Marinospirillum alkaliphilum]|uniref:Multidrug efflux pump subunit AcrB n=1 Tax=Marinospirillum alkaliphilum DSM 21637 TaxID=1122209 RepID=A0A1K1V9D9_9GAMM|nr:efflux RND transporter permease subunit [Marinospirillum alkaliphilum]SFX21720.1 Multidrug efflux pump subunit AcrB [Marinospirillum alkaliphilum DSM 21637]
MMSESPRLGLSGRIAAAFQTSRLTPLLALAGLLMGLFAVTVTPKEEEPQIDVTMADVFIGFPGASPVEVEQLVVIPAQQVLSEMAGVEHVYSVSRHGMGMVTVQFAVGVPRQEALVTLYNQIYSNQDWLPQNLGTLPPLIKAKGIDDVPIMALTLFSDDPLVTAEDLTRVAHTLETELKRIPGTRDIYTLGGVRDELQVILDPARLRGYGLELNDLQMALQAANATSQQAWVVQDGVAIPVQAGTLLTQVEEVQRLVVGMHDGAPVFLEDVAEVVRGGKVPSAGVMTGFGPAGERSAGHLAQAVTLAIAKQPGQNAIDITRAIGDRLELLQDRVIPEGVEVLVTRDYGYTAADKSNTLITKLLFATGSVVILVLAALGWRQALIVGIAVIITLAMTLFFSWAWGFTLNRVSLFALIFSIGILVDDAIVVVENIHRHLQLGAKSLVEAIPKAVDEVGGPTILATFTVIAALLPMAFVSGLMGPYMSPIPINASAGMLISLIIAFVVTPWLAVKLMKHEHHDSHGAGEAQGEQASGKMLRLFEKLMRPFLGDNRKRRWMLGGSVVGLTLAAALLPVTLAVVMKMLPFDNKSEFQVIVDMPEGTPVEQTQRVLLALGEYLETVPEVMHWQSYAGTAAPINFNGLVRQYYLRAEPHMGDLQVNLVDRRDRKRESHPIALSVREPLQRIGAEFGANVKIVEVPPGPPVLAPIVAEIYGPDAEVRAAVARQVEALLQGTEGIVDVDTTLEAPASRWLIEVDRDRAARLGVAQAQVVQALSMALGQVEVSFLHDEGMKYPVPIRLQLAEGDKAQASRLLSLAVRSRSGQLVSLSEFARVTPTDWQGAIYHKDLLPVTYVTADMAGRLDSPLYGMFDAVFTLAGQPNAPQQYFISQPDWPATAAIKWDGEWQITYETFRDMGIAYAVGMILIYMLVVAQFKSYLVPLVIMAPIPLTLIGIMPGHALLGAQFTATSMIGMIALAGIIVRNSILLVDFINQQLAEGSNWEDAVIQASAVRAQPIILTALAAMVGGFFIIDDPIFNGLAIALIFGLLVSTLLTLVVIPLLYYALYRHRGVPG